MVADIARLFAQLDEQPEPLATQKYSAALAERVRLFQVNQRLRADGVVGEQTLLRLNVLTQRDPTAAAAIERLVALSAAP